MNREQAVELMRKYVTAENLRQHCLATGVIMRALANKFGKDESKWEIWGLLHDLDFESTKDTPDKHGLRTAEMLRSEGFSEEDVRIIMSHNAEKLGIPPRQNLEEYALACAETVTGILSAAALVRPDKSIAAVVPSSVKKKMKDKAFAKNVDREVIKECEKIGLPLDDFLQLSINAMSSIAQDLGL